MSTRSVERLAILEDIAYLARELDHECCESIGRDFVPGETCEMCEALRKLDKHEREMGKPKKRKGKGRK